MSKKSNTNTTKGQEAVQDILGDIGGFELPAFTA